MLAAPVEVGVAEEVLALAAEQAGAVEPGTSISNPEYPIARRTSLPSLGLTLLSVVVGLTFAVSLLLLPLSKGEVFGWLPLMTVDLVVGSKKSLGLLAGS